MATVRFESSLVALLVLALTLAQGREIPDYINVCRRADPELAQCIMNTVEEIRPRLADGIPDLNVPSIEPLLIKEIIVAGATNSLFKVSATNVNAYGCSNFKITGMQADMEKYIFSFQLDLPLLNIDARYDVDGRILLIPIKGNGPMKLNITNTKADVLLNGEVYQKDGDDYIRFPDMNIKFDIGKGSVKLENLFGGEKTLGEAINAAINANFGGFLTELKPSIERELSSTMLEVANNVVKDFTLNQLFLVD
ncbi:protein takeout [Anabrus simplex]|uniref:protein takeout n=1 Tax=Anabrus simplex TaxID=316456 RepID=UPI0034DD5AB7